MPSAVAIFGSLSILCLAILQSFTVSEMLSNTGAIALHGAHHDAQKSTSTNLFSVISFLKFSSVDVIVAT
jgi:hypothetical protein